MTVILQDSLKYVYGIALEFGLLLMHAIITFSLAGRNSNTSEY